MNEEDLAVTADLANIALQPEEMARLRDEVGAMVAFFEKMGELDVANLSAASAAADAKGRIRPDAIQPSGLADAILEQAPDLEDRFVCIPNVL